MMVSAASGPAVRAMAVLMRALAEERRLTG
jgi:hypothetical protein